jgi:hypothetical protein
MECGSMGKQKGGWVWGGWVGGVGINKDKLKNSWMGWQPVCTTQRPNKSMTNKLVELGI